MGALINGVFLVALCLSIFLDAVQRFFEPQTVSNPRLVLVVGCFGLLSNILGLFLFHEHNHGHGGEAGHGGHNHPADELRVSEEGHSHSHPAISINRSPSRQQNSEHPSLVSPRTPGQNEISSFPDLVLNPPGPTSKSFNRSDEDDSTVATSTSSQRQRKSSYTRRHGRHASGSRPRYNSVDEIPVLPAEMRRNIIKSGRLDDIESSPGTESEGDETVMADGDNASSHDGEMDVDTTEESPLLNTAKSSGSKHSDQASATHRSSRSKSESLHKSHNHTKAKDASAGAGSDHGHSHSDLNMRGVFLHVLGDALGNIGVIGSALIIWLTTSPYRFYADPIISLLITIIILGSALPLCRAASRILLQAVPVGISIDEIVEDVEGLPGVISCHHVHVWQLSGEKLVASLHVQVSFPAEGGEAKDENKGGKRYMQLARIIRNCLHGYGIHSSTIQPEFLEESRTEATHPQEEGTGSANRGSSGNSRGNGKTKGNQAVTSSTDDTCLLDCGDECGDGKGCCSPTTAGGLGDGGGVAHQH